MAIPSLPIIGEFEYKTQLAILASLFAISYLYRVPRLILSGLVALYSAYTYVLPVAVSTLGWIIWLAKTIAMLGFYIHFFQLGIGYLATGMAFLSSDVQEWLVRGLEAYESSRS